MDYHKEYGIAVAQEKEQMIRERTIQEQEFERVKNVLLTANPEYLEVLPEDFASWTLQRFIPEWYVDKPNKEKAESQRIAFNEELERINMALYEKVQEVKKESDRIYEGAGANGS